MEMPWVKNMYKTLSLRSLFPIRKPSQPVVDANIVIHDKRDNAIHREWYNSNIWAESERGAKLWNHVIGWFLGALKFPHSRQRGWSEHFAARRQQHSVCQFMFSSITLFSPLSSRYRQHGEMALSYFSSHSFEKREAKGILMDEKSLWQENVAVLRLKGFRSLLLNNVH